MRRIVILTAVAAFLLAGLPRRFEILALEFYQKAASPAMSLMVTCRFQPTCSNYALEALRRDGFWEGNWQIAVRLVHCSPIGLILPSDPSRPAKNGPASPS